MTPRKLVFLNIGLNERLTDVESFSKVHHRGQVLELNPHDVNASPKELVGQDYMPDGIDYSRTTGRLYWTHMGQGPKNDGSVYSMKLDGSDIKCLVKEGEAHTCKQCVVDDRNSKLYFCDREGLRVFRINLDGTGLEVLMQRGDWANDPETITKDPRNWPVGIAISHRLDKIFWSQKGPSKGGQGRIFSANMTMPLGSIATNRQDIELVAGDLPEPIDLEFDDTEGALYWTDRGEPPFGNTLNKKQIIGRSSCEEPLGRQILAQGFCEAIGLKLDRENHCIWVSDMCGHIWQCDPDKPALKRKVYEGETGSFTGLTFV